MDSLLIILIIFFLAVNLLAFFVMFLDKAKAKKQKTERISEGFLFFLAAVFGSIGVYCGMFAFRHKTQKWYFLVGIPIIMLQNIAFLYLVYYLTR
jgi:uncharacterized membrane protein YsdA (DUF1294 family)